MVWLVRSNREERCLRRLLAGADAWPLFWDVFGGLILYELGQLGLAQPPDRDDVFQELALRLINQDLKLLRDHVAQYGYGGQGFGALLRIVVRSVAVDFIRKRSRRKTDELTPQLEFEAHRSEGGAGPWADDPARAVARAEQEDLLARLTGAKRGSDAFRILCLRFIDQEDVSTVAAQLGMKPNTVSQRIKYYVERLKRMPGGTLPEWRDE